MLDLFNIYYKDSYLKYRENPDDEILGFALECHKNVWRAFVELARVNNLKLSDFTVKVLKMETGLITRLELDSLFAQFYDFGDKDTSIEVLEDAVGILFDNANNFVRRFVGTDNATELVGVSLKLTKLVGTNKEIMQLDRIFGKTADVDPMLPDSISKRVEELYNYYREVH